MRIELICTGNELLEGKLNTNAALLGERVFNTGFRLDRVTTVNDTLSDIEDAFRES